MTKTIFANVDTELNKLWDSVINEATTKETKLLHLLNVKSEKLVEMEENKNFKSLSTLLQEYLIMKMMLV